jgi:histone H3/H4
MAVIDLYPNGDERTMEVYREAAKLALEHGACRIHNVVDASQSRTITDRDILLAVVAVMQALNGGSA